MDHAANERELLSRIAIEPGKCGGRPRVRGMRIRATDVLDPPAAGLTPEQVVGQLPALEIDDVRAAILYASRRLGPPRLVA
jgi:uncharacterized protein (DUF433 family)